MVPSTEDLPELDEQPSSKTGREQAGDTDVLTTKFYRKEHDSLLNKQVGLFRAAKNFASKSNYRRALSKLDTLNRKFPDGPLTFESKQLRARCLFRMGRFADAATVIEELLSVRSSSRKKAELLRFLGDVQFRQNRCNEAIESYRRALGLGLLRPRESEAAKQGIKRCKQ